MDEDDKNKYDKWRDEANRKYAGKWVYRENWENL